MCCVMITKTIVINPIAYVKNSRNDFEDIDWDDYISEIELVDSYSEDAFEGIKDFSHIEIIFYFDRMDHKVANELSHPRNNDEYPLLGIFAQRKAARPNHIGATIAKLIKREGNKLIVTNLDALNGTPVLDIKPIMKEFLPQEEVTQPGWSTDLMKGYWKR